MTSLRRSFPVILFLTTATLSAGENVWTSNGPPGHVVALAQDAASSTLYAATWLPEYFVYRSVDQGRTWNVIFQAPVGSSIVRLAVDPNATGAVYASVSSTAPGATFFRSTDGGTTWFGLSSLSQARILVLAVRPGSPGTLYAGGDVCIPRCFGALYESADEGVTWRVVVVDLQMGRPIRVIGFDPRDPNRIYAGGAFGISVSTDAGAHWTHHWTGEGCPSVLALAVRVSDGVVFAGTGSLDSNRFLCGGLFRSDDAGATWTRTRLPSYYVTSVALDPNDRQTIYVGTSRIGFFSPGGGVFRSEDGGETWAPFGSGLPPQGVDQLVIESSGRILHAATSEGVYDYEIVPGARPPVIPPRSRGTRSLSPRP